MNMGVFVSGRGLQMELTPLIFTTLNEMNTFGLSVTAQWRQSAEKSSLESKGLGVCEH